MKPNVIRFNRLVPFHPYWLFVSIENAIIIAFACLLALLIMGGSLDLPIIVAGIVLYIVSVPNSIFCGVTVDEMRQSIQTKGSFNITLLTIAISDIQEVHIDITKHYGKNILLNTTKGDYKLSVGDSEQFVKVLTQLKKDITIVR